MRYQRSVLLASACASVLAMAVASAQTSDARKQDKIASLEEIVVTAQRREESLQEVPIAVTALTAESRELIGITTIEDMTNFVPGLTYEGQLDRASIRGVGRVTNQPGTDPGVGLYTDGVYNSSTTSAARSTIFNERVEVLRGPQGSLYGRNTTGGAINTVSRGARDTFGGEARATMGTYGRRIMEGTFTGPIADWLRFRMTAVSTIQDDGYFKNQSKFGDEGGVQDDVDYVALLSGDLGQSVDFTVRYSHQEQYSLARFSANLTQPAYNNTATSTALFGLSTTSQISTFASRGGLQPSSLFNGAGVSANTIYQVPNPTTVDNRRLFSANVPANRVLDGSDQISLNLIWHLAFADLKYVGAYTAYEFYSWSDTDNIAREYYDYTPVTNTGTAGAPVITPVAGVSPVRVYTGSRFRFFEDKEYWSNEFTLTSSGDSAFTWIGGLYQYHERYEQIPIALETSNPEQTQLHTVYARPANPIVPSRPVTGGPAVTMTTAEQIAAYNALPFAYDNPTGATSSTTGIGEVSTYALFGQTQYKFSDAWTTSLGGRLSRDEKEGMEKRYSVLWDPSIVGAAARAYDNSAPNDCRSLDAANPVRAQYQSTINTATGAEIPLTATSTSYSSQCRTRTFEKRTYDGWTANTGLDWKPMNDFLAYAKYSRGYKSGAIRFGSFALDAETDPESINSYEIGTKFTLASRYQFNASAFYYDYKDYQFPVTERIDDGAGGNASIQTYTNLEKAETYGFEMEATMTPWRDLSLLLSYSYLHTEIKSDLYIVDPNDLSASFADATADVIVLARSSVAPFAPTLVAQNVKGNSLPNSPKNKVAGNITYAFRFAGGTLTPSASFSWRDSLSSGGLSVSAFSRGRNSTPSYTTTDARLTWTDAERRFSIIGYVANALDDETVNGASSTTVNGEPQQVYNLNPPRTYGLAIYLRFGADQR